MHTKKVHYLVFLVFGLFSGCQQFESFYSSVSRTDVFVQRFSVDRIDFLWVMDNSGSMEPRRRFVRDNLQAFINLLSNRKAVDYQMAFVTTNVHRDQGDLVQSTSGLDVVRSSISIDPIKDAADIINNIQDSASSFWEQGLRAAYLALSKHRSRFSREGTPLYILFLADEDDFSCKSMCYGREPERNLNWEPDPLHFFIQFFKTIRNDDGGSLYMFPIVITDPHTCAHASIGYRYMKVAQALGEPSQSVSVCDNKLQESFMTIAKTISDKASRFKLSFRSQGKNMKVYVDQKLVPNHPDYYIFDEKTNELVFTGAIPDQHSVIHVAYQEHF